MAVAAGTRPHAPFGSLCRFIRSSRRQEAAEDRCARRAPNNRTVERELEISRGGSKGFWQVNVDRLGNISENPNTVDGSEWRR